MILTRRLALAAALALPATLAACAPKAGTGGAVKLGQATTSLSFLPIWAARAYDSFAAAGASLDWAPIAGGDPAALAALDAGDIDLAAVGSDTAIAAIAKGQPFVLVHVLMGKMSLEVVASKRFLAKTGVAPADPLPHRIAALKDAVIGVSAAGGAQDRAVRWIAAQGGLDPATLKLAVSGAPPAIQAALENGRIDAFILSPPEGQIAEAGGYGQRLIQPGAEFPTLKAFPSLVLAAKANPDDAHTQRIRTALAALNQGSQKAITEPDGAADRIQAQFFPKVPQAILRAGLRDMVDGIAGLGRFTPEGIAAARSFSAATGTPAPAGDGWWTNRFLGA